VSPLASVRARKFQKLDEEGGDDASEIEMGVQSTMRERTLPPSDDFADFDSNAFDDVPSTQPTLAPPRHNPQPAPKPSSGDDFMDIFGIEPDPSPAPLRPSNPPPSGVDSLLQDFDNLLAVGQMTSNTLPQPSTVPVLAPTPAPAPATTDFGAEWGAFAEAATPGTTAEPIDIDAMDQNGIVASLRVVPQPDQPVTLRALPCVRVLISLIS